MREATQAEARAAIDAVVEKLQAQSEEQRFARLVGRRVLLTPSNKVRRISGFKIRKYGIVIQFTQCVRHAGESLYQVPSRDCALMP